MIDQKDVGGDSDQDQTRSRWIHFVSKVFVAAAAAVATFI